MFSQCGNESEASIQTVVILSWSLFITLDIIKRWHMLAKINVLEKTFFTHADLPHEEECF